jgi:hypothetical protein
MVGGQWSRNAFENKLGDFCEKSLEQWGLYQATGCLEHVPYTFPGLCVLLSLKKNHVGMWSNLIDCIT